jgi:diguanylate cyclase (GGDEF)-like protein
MKLDADARSVILDAIASGIVVLDLDGRVLVWNRWMARHSGLPAENAIGRLFAELFPEIEGTRLGSALNTALAHRLAGIIAPSIHKPYLPLYKNAASRERNDRLPQFIQISPISLGGMAACTLQIQDVTIAVHRENLLRDQSADLATRNLQLNAQLQEIQTLQAEILARDAQDPLTGVLNRKHLEKRLHTALHEKQSFTLALIDVDHLKRINEEQGFGAGDSVIQTLAKLIREHIPANASVGRYESDEFLVILPLVLIDQAQVWVESWRAEFAAQPIYTVNQQVDVSFSAGIAVFPDHGETDEALIQCLNLSLFIAKHDGGDRIVTYEQAKNDVF